jgi:hypothetical protein
MGQRQTVNTVDRVSAGSALVDVHLAIALFVIFSAMLFLAKDDQIRSDPLRRCRRTIGDSPGSYNAKDNGQQLSIQLP